MKIAIIISSNDSETVWNAFRFANTCLSNDCEVYVFLLGKGVEAGVISTLQYDIDERMSAFRSKGGTLIGCGVCCDSRMDEIPSLKERLQCETGSMQQLYDLVSESDKIVSF